MPCHSDHAPMMRLVSAGAQRHIEQQQQLPLGLGGPGPGRVVQQPRQQHVPAGPRAADRPDGSAVDREAAQALPHPGADAARAVGPAAAAGPAAVAATAPSRQQGREQQRQVGRLQVAALCICAGDMPCLSFTAGFLNCTCQYVHCRQSSALELEVVAAIWWFPGSVSRSAVHVAVTVCLLRWSLWVTRRPHSCGMDPLRGHCDRRFNGSAMSDRRVLVNRSRSASSGHSCSSRPGGGRGRRHSSAPSSARRPRAPERVLATLERPPWSERTPLRPRRTPRSSC